MGILAENIKNFRLMTGLSQKELGDKLHKSPNVISNWEKGINSPDVDIVADLCDIFKCTPNQIFGWDSCPELDNFLNEKQELIDAMNTLLAKRECINKQIKEYSDKISRRR